MKFEITKDVIKDLIGMFGKEQAIKELQGIINDVLLGVVDEAIEETK